MQQDQLNKYRRQAKNDDSAVQKGLMKIYSNSDGSLPDISHLEIKRRARWKIILVGTMLLLGFLAALSWLGYILINPNQNLNDRTIDLKIKGQQNIASGDEVVYTLEYHNNEKVVLHDVQIILRYPDGFEFISANPAPTNGFNTSWDIGELAKGESGKIEITGKLIGEVGSLKNLNATVSFRPENFSSVFKETESFSSQITSSILELKVEGPEKILPEKKVSYKINYRNNSAQALKKIKIQVTYPANFVFQESAPPAFSREEDARNLHNQWIIENLESNQEGEIEISGGYLKNQEMIKADLKVELGFLDSETEEFSLQQEKIFTTEVVDPGLSLNLIINGSTQDQPINFGQTLTYSIVYKNLGQSDLNNVVVSLDLDSEILDFDTLEDKNKGQRDNQRLTWSKDEISGLALLRPLDEGTIDIAIQIKNAGSIDIQNTQLTVKSQARVTLEKIGELAVDDLNIESGEIENNINTDLELAVEGRYFNDDNIAVGTGPLPPVVGQKTSFRIYWSIANSLHPVSNIKVKTILPDGVEWENKYLVQGGSISYSSADRSVVWSIDNINTNQTFDDHNVWFDISVTPTAQQVRKLIILTDQTTLTATDQTTESSVNRNGKAVTSNLEDDPIAGGKGLVIDITE
ncbi:MAG: hypothetical protein RB292_01430 [Patescibacteria group bacterium]|jgi:uncharacterized repeat protein (TIGR01451 family)|nr:hypothetical protein [Patescibacteria group bacterium]